MLCCAVLCCAVLCCAVLCVCVLICVILLAVSGIGFLGAGAILREAPNATVLHGITTAASLWVSMAIGLATGAGYWWGAAAGTVFTLICLIALRQVRKQTQTYK